MKKVEDLTKHEMTNILLRVMYHPKCEPQKKEVLELILGDPETDETIMRMILLYHMKKIK
jgi:hypothetical protein